MTSTTETTCELKPLWPKGLKIPFIGVTGEYQAGKTLFALTIDPQHTVAFDTEKSSETYESSLGFRRIDLADVMRKKFPAGNYRPRQLFEEWLQLVQTIEPGRFRVMVLDTVSEIETGLVEYVRGNPNQFGYTSGQFSGSQALMWGAAKNYWKQILTDIAGRVETFVVVAHMRDKWQGGRPTGEREAKGKETIMEMASLYLELNRDAVNGKTPAKPAARVLKSRLSTFALDEKTGEMEPRPILPPRIAVCTPAEIRKYVESPPDYSKLKKGEQLEERTLSADEKLLIERDIAEKQADAARLQLEAAEKAAVQQPATASPESAANPAVATSGPKEQEATVAESSVSQDVTSSVLTDSGHDARPAEATESKKAPVTRPAETESVIPAGDSEGAISTETVAVEMITLPQQTEMLKLYKQSGITAEAWSEVKTKLKFKTASEMTKESADRLLTWLQGVVDQREKTGELKDWAEEQTGSGDGSPASPSTQGDASQDEVPF